MEQQAAITLFQYGLAGVVILGLTIAVVTLYKDNKQLQKEKELVMEARRADAENTVDKVTGPLTNIGTTMELVLGKLEVGDNRRRR